MSVGDSLSQIIKLGHFTNIVHCIDTVCVRVFYTNPCLKEDAYICELPNLHNLYITSLFADYHPNNPPILKDIATFYI